ncbi:unnamed protein product [Cylicocyclus nassatus]|uniref:Uncharacterized protein n=1 Tax=Cylicocyclus nassatus TaxID=53992 RepID=A0AA36GLS1_CYLNA|nr:unnamed protein product [Cylicocyclus nassatus]
MRFFNHVFFLLAILLILSAVDVGECGIKEFLEREHKLIKCKPQEIISHPIVIPLRRH